MDHSGHHDHQESGNENHSKMNHEHMLSDFKKKFFVSLLLTIPIFFLSPMIGKIFGLSFSFFGDAFILFVLASVIFFYGGKSFLLGAKREFQERSFGMMTLISLAIIASYGYSSLVVFGLHGEVFFWELATLIDVMLLGHWIEMRSVMGASMALEKIAKLIPDRANLKRGENIESIKTDKLREGDVILIRPGERIPADGVVVMGESSVNEAAFTGESKPSLKKVGKKVVAGSINEDGSLGVRVGSTRKNFYISRVMKLVKEVQSSKSKSQHLADRAAFYLTVIAIISSALTFAFWVFFSSDLAFIMERSVTVLVIACPHALGLAIPLVVSISTTISSQNGFLIRNRNSLEDTKKISIVVFDKTGTLTKGKFGVEKIKTLDPELREDEMLGIVASLENNSEHLIGRAIVKEAKKRHIKLDNVSGFKALKGKGVEGVVRGDKYFVISMDHAQDFSLTVPGEIKREIGTVVLVLRKEQKRMSMVGSIVLSDQIRDGSHMAVEILKENGIKTWMITGDNEKVANSVSQKIGINGFFASVLPHEKQEKIKELQEKGEFVVMVGDGVNDAPAIAQADIGIAIGEGTDIASETADVILVRNNPVDVVRFIAFGKEVRKKIIQNLVWASGYNVVAIPLAAGVLFGSGILLSPALGALLMSLSTVVVAINAKSLRMDKK